MSKNTKSLSQYSKSVLKPNLSKLDLSTLSCTVDKNGKSTTYVPKPGKNPWCNDEVDTDWYQSDPKNYISLNQRLAGPANPKTFIKPVVIAPPPSLDFWKANNLINYSQINTESQFDSYLSGYDASNCCDIIDASIQPTEIANDRDDVIENFQMPSDTYSMADPNFVNSCGRIPCDGGVPVKVSSQNDDRREDYFYSPGGYYEGISDQNHPVKHVDQLKSHVPIVSPIPTVMSPGTAQYPVNKCTNPPDRNTQKEYFVPAPTLKKYVPIVSPTPMTTSPTAKYVGGKYGFQEGFEMPDKKLPFVKPNETGWVNTTCGYNPQQLLDAGLPTNYNGGNCEKDPSMKQYNENLFTQNIGPDTYTRNQVVEPINANIGISFTQQFEPRTCHRDEKGLMYTEHDPRIAPCIPKVEARHATATEYNVYDPRFSGYGSSYRAYTDEMTGQTRFYYDDINAVRMPNYVSRSNLDFAPYADSYGPLEDCNKNGNPWTNLIRPLGQDTWLRSNVEQRDGLSSSLMRKRNAELWQNRMYPKYTM